jgi:predicted outer membrane repeat protein
VKRLLAVMVGTVCLVLPAAGSAATFSVNSTADGPVVGTCAAGETCTLRDAFSAAAASADAEDTIAVPEGTYTLSSGELAIETAGTVNILGAGARRTIVNGAGASRVFSLRAATGALDATISGLTVTGGAETTAGAEVGDGGGILLGEGGNELTLRGVAVTGNTATVNGGGIAAPLESGVPKAVTIEDSTISGNKIVGGAGIGLGGGVYVTGNLSMTNSTVVGNAVENAIAANEGGGVVAGPGTGTEPTQTRIVNSDIVGNSVGTGTGGGFSMYNPTALAGASSTITNTIISGNTAAGAKANCGGALTVVSSNNLSDDASCLFTDAASKTGDPKLGQLANNGGETDTLALLAGSPAIDAGTVAGCPASDQRGVLRPFGTACDIGAFEYQPTPAGGPGGSSGSQSGGGAPAGADLKLTIKPKPKKPRRGKKFAFLVTVRDAGPSAAPGVVFKGTVPAATRKVKVKGLGKKACKLGKATKGRRALACNLGTVAVGKALSFRIRERTRVAPRKLRAAGAVTSTLADPTPADAKAKARAKLRG